MPAARPITILGGGLAGLSLGIALRSQGIPTTLREAGDYPRHRICGEFISGIDNATLDALAITDCLSDALLLSETAWFQDGTEVLRRQLPLPARAISRHRLDHRLAKRFRALGGDLRTSDRAPDPDPRNSEGTVDARGRRPQRGPWVGLKSHYLELPTKADLEMHLIADGYLGISKIEGGRTNVCGLFRGTTGSRDLADVLDRRGAGHLAARLRTAEEDTASRCGTGGFQLGWQPAPAETSCLAIGDRSAMTPPFTGNGMSMAFQSAATVLPSLIGYSGGILSWPSARTRSDRLLRSQFGRRLPIARAAHGFLHYPAGQAVLGALARGSLLPFPALFHLTRS